MKLRQADKILKRVSIESWNNQRFGIPLSKSWHKLMCKAHKARAVHNHHRIPFGRIANKWGNEYIAKICKRTKKED